MKLIYRNCVVTFLFFGAFSLIATVYYVNYSNKPEDNFDPNSIRKVSLDFQRNHSFCAYRRLSPEEAAEENLILNSIAWPETPPLRPPLTNKDTSDPAHSSFVILPKHGGGPWVVGDQLEVMIKMFDYNGQPKKYGGDVLLSRLHDRALDAGVTSPVLDHLDGTYSVFFPLLWEGSAQVEVTLVHPSEAVPILQKLTYNEPDRVTYTGLFQSGSVKESTTCYVCRRQTQRAVCDYTDARTGEPWFCYKPKTLTCDHRTNHLIGPLNGKAFQSKELFKRGNNLKVFIGASGPGAVTVLPKTSGQPGEKQGGVASGVVGYYYKGIWNSLTGTPVRQFNTSSAMTKCLTKKVIHMYGDSTIRQWFEHLKKVLPGLREFNLHNPAQSGPLLALDYDHNIKVTFRCHGPPIRFDVSSSELRYIANELDGVPGGADTVIIIGIWAHYTTFPIEIYTRRLLSIRKAVVRLLTRAPNTVIIIRTANLRSLARFEVLTPSDWYSMQRDKVLRTVFKGINVHLVDAWAMTGSHWLPHNIHPGPPIIRNMINVILSYIC